MKDTISLVELVEVEGTAARRARYEERTAFAQSLLTPDKEYRVPATRSGININGWIVARELVPPRNHIFKSVMSSIHECRTCLIYFWSTSFVFIGEAI